MPLRSSTYEAVVASYHVEDSEDEIDYDDAGLMSRRSPWSHPLIGESHQSFAMNAINSSEDEDEDVAAAKAELDGLRRPQRTYNPLTIIQIKNAERNLDSRGHQDSQWWSVWHFAQYYSRLRLCATAFLCLGLLVVGLMLWSSTSYHNCQNAALCQSSNPSVLPNRLKRNAQWSKTYEDIGLTSGLEVVKLDENQEVVVSGFESASEATTIMENSKTASTAESGGASRRDATGLIALRPDTGQELWRQSLKALPRKHDCNLVDVNGDGLQDCLVVGDGGLLTAIEPRTGQELWYMHYHWPIVNISLPRKLPDLDGDQTSELVAACAVTLPSEMTDNHIHIRTSFILISGKKGKVMGQPYQVDMCTDIGAINVTSNLALQFDCTSEHGADQFEMTLDEFYTKATNKPSENFAINEAKISGRAAEYRQFNTIGEDSTHTVKDSIHLDWTPVSGYCLECGVTVKIWDGFAHRLLWNQTWKRAVAFQPLSTRYEGDRSDSPIEGFVFRLWQWDDDVGDTFTIGRPSKPIQTTLNDLEVEDDLTSEDNDNDDEYHSSLEEEEESIFAKYGQNNDDYDIEDEIDLNHAGAGVGVGVSDVLSNMLPFARPANMRGLLSLKLSDSAGHYRGGRGGSGKSSKSSSHHRNSLRRGSEHYSVKPHRRRKKLLSAEQHQNAGQRQNVRLLSVNETIFYATLNHTSPQVISLYSHYLVQQCVQKTPFSPYHCHPHYNRMPNSMVILEHSEDGPDWRDFVFATSTYIVDSKRFETSLHKFSLSKDIVHVTQAAAAASQEG